MILFNLLFIFILAFLFIHSDSVHGESALRANAAIHRRAASRTILIETSVIYVFLTRVAM